MEITIKIEGPKTTISLNLHDIAGMTERQIQEFIESKVRTEYNKLPQKLEYWIGYSGSHEIDINIEKGPVVL